MLIYSYSITIYHLIESICLSFSCKIELYHSCYLIAFDIIPLILMCCQNSIYYLNLFLFHILFNLLISSHYYLLHLIPMFVIICYNNHSNCYCYLSVIIILVIIPITITAVWFNNVFCKSYHQISPFAISSCFWLSHYNLPLIVFISMFVCCYVYIIIITIINKYIYLYNLISVSPFIQCHYSPFSIFTLPSILT